MEMIVCNANTNWLRGERESKKGFQKEENFFKKLDCTKTWTHLYMFRPVVKIIIYGKIIINTEEDRRFIFLHLTFISHLCSVWPHHL